MRIAIAGFSHETNSFAAERNDTMDSVRLLRGPDIVAQAHPRSFIGGFLEAAAARGVEVVPTVTAGFARGGPIGAAVFEQCRNAIVSALREATPVDGVYLALHGAAVADPPYTDTEGDLVREIRKVIGDIPLCATYDFHAIMSDAEAEALVPFPNNTNPHIDGYERGLEAGECLVRMVEGEIHPVTRRIFVPIIGPNIGQSTWSHLPEEESRLPLYRLNLEREELERTPGVLNVTLLGGYGYGDSPDAGMCVLTTADGDADLADRVNRQLGRRLWDVREELVTVRPIHPIDEGVRMAMAREDRPVLLVDLGDDPGSACSADSPAVLESLIRQGAHDCVLTIRDADVVRAGMAAGVGATLTMPVGATVDQRYYKPVDVTGRVKSIDDGNYTILGPTHGGWSREVTPEAFREANVGPRVVLRVGDRIDVVFSEGRTGKDRDFFKSAGIQLDAKEIIVVKSNQAHRASFDPIVAGTVELNTPGASTVDYASLPYQHLTRPIWPVDRDMDWDPHGRRI